MTDRWVVGDRSGLPFPADPAALRDGGTAFLSTAFQEPVRSITRYEEVSGGSTGRKALLDVEYVDPATGRDTELFVKFSRDFDDPIRDRGRTQMESEVVFAELSRAPGFPITVPRTAFADYHAETGTGIVVSQRIAFGVNGIEPQYHKCLDYEMPAAVDHYRALLTAVAGLAGAGRLADHFPVDLRAAAVGEPPPLTTEKLQRRVARLIDFTVERPALFPASVRSADFHARLEDEAVSVFSAEPAMWRYLTQASDYIALSHWNANVDNAWFWTDADGVLRCGLMDWGCVSQLNVAMAIWGAMSAAETDLWDNHFDEFARLFCDEVRAAGGPTLDPVELGRQVVLYAALMGVTWLMDVPALIRTKAPDAVARTDPAIKDDEGLRAPLQMLTNVLNLWERSDISAALGRCTATD